MSKNNSIKKSDKKFIRNEKARIRATILDVKKQEELITELYKKFLKSQNNAETNPIPEQVRYGASAKSRGKKDAVIIVESSGVVKTEKSTKGAKPKKEKKDN